MFIMSTLISSCPQDSLSLVHLCRASPDRYDFNPCPAQSPVTRRIINGRRRPYFNFAPPLQMESVHNNLWTCVFGRRVDGIRSTWACVFHVDVNLSFESVGYPPPPPATCISIHPSTWSRVPLAAAVQWTWIIIPVMPPTRICVYSTGMAYTRPVLLPLVTVVVMMMMILGTCVTIISI